MTRRSRAGLLVMPALEEGPSRVGRGGSVLLDERAQEEERKPVQAGEVNDASKK